MKYEAELRAAEALLQFGIRQGLMEADDTAQVRNRIFSCLKFAPEDVDESLFNAPEDIGELPFNAPDVRAETETATKILSALSDGYAARGLFKEDTIAARDQLEAELMCLCMPRMSEIKKEFERLYCGSAKAATDWFYKLCRASNYIQVDRIKKDMYWTTATEYGELEITVNLSKPEKDPRDIAAARLKPDVSYPKCLLCAENVGFEGTRVWPARQNLRVVPITLDGERWYFQYSPYAYYNEHCIVLSESHRPMRISEQTFKRLVEFVQKFPHYFIGSNADLPIVGGSILSHDHFQGGRHVFPMEKAEAFAHYTHRSFPGIDISLLKWPLSVVRLTGKDKTSSGEKLIELAVHILNAWRGYSDPEAEILSETDGVPHNTVTPIARYNRNGELEIDLALRNNRASEEHPMGIFHPHAQWHHIKKENIGLIEVMGLAVLPGRLKSDTLNKEEVGQVFKNVLNDCGVFKNDRPGKERFDVFMNAVLR